MESLLAAFIAYISAEPVMASVAGAGFHVRVAEVWNLQGSLGYPVLALNLERQRDPLRGATAPIRASRYLLRCWYVTNGTMYETLSMRDTVKKALHNKQSALASNGVFVSWIECNKTTVTYMADVTKHQAYLEFDVIG